MSIQSLPPRVYTRLGRFTLALLVGAVLALSGLLPSVALAHTQGHSTASASDLTQQYVLDKAGVSVVRLKITYSNSSNQKEIVVCTGLGALVGSTNSGSSGSHQSWVLTDANLLSSTLPACGLVGADGATIQIIASDAYTQSTPAHPSPFTLGQISCAVNILGENAVSSCQDENSTISEMSISVPNEYTLFSFQTPTEQPYLTLAHSPVANPTTLGLMNSSNHAFPSIKVDSSGSNQPQNYLAPAIVSPIGGNAGNPPPNVQGSPTAISALPNGIEPGAPHVDASGDLAGMYLSSGTPLDSSIIVEELRSAIPSASAPNPNSLAALWDSGMDAYHQGTQASCQQAHTAFQNIAKITPLNTNFKAASAFAGLAQTCSLPKPPGPLPQSTSNNSSLSLLIGLVAGLVVLLLVLVLVTLRVGHARKHRRELARFTSEQAEAHRLAEAELQRQRTQAQVPEMLCPNCHQPVHLSDTMCRYCRYPLSPSASGLNIRLAGSSPIAATAPLSTGPRRVQVPPSMPSVSDLPTVQFTPSPSELPTIELRPNFAASGTVPSGEKTTKRKKSPPPPPPPQETVSDLQQMPGRNLSLTVGTRSDPGLKRKHKPNEDSLFAMQWDRMHNSQNQQVGLFVIADGMGGHANGQDASRTAIQTIINYMLPRISSSEATDDESFKKLLSDGVQNANLAVHNRNLETHADMGTTMTAALVVGTTAYVANVGDSRTYFYRNEQGLSKVTMDHSVVASLVEAGIIQPDDIYTHPKRNQIYRSLGEKPEVEVDTFQRDVQPGDKFLLCSDGLWDMVRDPLIQQMMSKPTNDPNKTGQELIKAALQGGGEDNVTVIVVQFSELNTRTGTTGVQLLAKPETVTLPSLPPV